METQNPMDMSVINGVGSNLILTYSQFNRTLPPLPTPQFYPALNVIISYSRDECGPQHINNSAQSISSVVLRRAMCRWGVSCCDNIQYFHFPSPADIMTPTHMASDVSN